MREKKRSFRGTAYYQDQFYFWQDIYLAYWIVAAVATVWLFPRYPAIVIVPILGRLALAVIRGKVVEEE